MDRAVRRLGGDRRRAGVVGGPAPGPRPAHRTAGQPGRGAVAREAVAARAGGSGAVLGLPARPVAGPGPRRAGLRTGAGGHRARQRPPRRGPRRTGLGPDGAVGLVRGAQSAGGRARRGAAARRPRRGPPDHRRRARRSAVRACGSARARGGRPADGAAPGRDRRPGRCTPGLLADAARGAAGHPCPARAPARAGGCLVRRGRPRGPRRGAAHHGGDPGARARRGDRHRARRRSPSDHRGHRTALPLCGRHCGHVALGARARQA